MPRARLWLAGGDGVCMHVHVCGLRRGLMKVQGGSQGPLGQEVRGLSAAQLEAVLVHLGTAAELLVAGKTGR